MKSQKTKKCSPLKSIYTRDCKSGWDENLKHILTTAENAESELAHNATYPQSHTRSQSGSFYTPTDASILFWNEFLFASQIKSKRSALNLLKNFHFIEPAAGAGALIFSLFLKLSELGLSPKEIASINIKIFDINKSAIDFISKQLHWLESKEKIKFSNTQLICSDFLTYRNNDPEEKRIIFANPPFIASKGKSYWRNSYADFLEASLIAAGKHGVLHFIIPLSFSFSKNYKKLRVLTSQHPRSIFISHFDNIPDTLFKSGKPENTNTNKANSQRCSIISITPSSQRKIFSTQLHRWSRKNRGAFLTKAMSYHEVTEYNFDDQIPRPDSKHVLDYLKNNKPAMRLSDIFSENGNYELNVSAVARNYIGIRDKSSSGSHKLIFSNLDNFYRAFLIITSDLFFSYWRTVGDGFHLTKNNIYQFPIQKDYLKIIDKNIPVAKKLWKIRKSYSKNKLNAGKYFLSYDFSKVAMPFPYK